MSGPNEHHIPQFLQRPFGVPRSGKKPAEIWLYVRDREPELRAISKTGSEDYFYGSDLDAKLKVPENALGQKFATLRNQAIGTAVDPTFASELISHLAPRSKHVRTAMANVFHHLADGTRSLFADRTNLSVLLGLDKSEPNDQFSKHLSDAIENNPQLKAIGLPIPVLERVAFYVTREQFDINAGSTTSIFDSILGNWSSVAPTVARDSHNRVLAKMSEGANPRRDRLARFFWSIEQAPSEGALLPDCVALAYAHGESAALPMMLMGAEVQCVVMPISTRRLLVGRTSSAELINLLNFNEDAAACCEEFFLAHSRSSTLQPLADLIGTRAMAYFEDAIGRAVSDILPSRSVDTSGVVESGSTQRVVPDTGYSFSYNFQCLDIHDEETIRHFSNVIIPVVEQISRLLPMDRLDGITVAVDYNEALRTLDRGSDLLPPIAEEGPREVGIIGNAIPVVRQGQVKGRVVLSASAVNCLGCDDHTVSGLGYQTLVHQLALVAMLELFERAVPDGILSPATDDPFQAGLFLQVRDALNGAIAARVAGDCGDGVVLASNYRFSLCEALKRMKTVSEEERRTFPDHRDAMRLGAALLPTVRRALYYAGLLLGHCEATGEPITSSDGELTALLEELSLAHWLVDFHKELLVFWGRLGRWDSPRDFLAFNRHVERLLWAVGVFPWQSPEGERLEVFQLPKIETR